MLERGEHCNPGSRTVYIKRTLFFRQQVSTEQPRIMTPTVTSTVAQRAKHPCGRRNTLIHPYVRHGLGFSTAEWEESLTVKFRNLPSRERRLYTLSLGYGLREDNNFRGAHNNTSVKRKRRAEMTRDHALTLMARFHEMLLHGERTVEGIFSALGIEARCGSSVCRMSPKYIDECLIDQILVHPHYV